jgi:hypothetical protein
MWNEKDDFDSKGFEKVFLDGQCQIASKSKDKRRYVPERKEHLAFDFAAASIDFARPDNCPSD